MRIVDALRLRVWRLSTLLLVIACDLDRGRFSEYAPAAERYVAAAAKGDFGAVAEMSADSIPVEWMRLTFEDEPDLLRIAATEGLQAIGGTVRRDTTFVRFSFSYKGKPEVLSFRFIQRGNVRLITNVALPERM